MTKPNAQTKVETAPEVRLGTWVTMIRNLRMLRLLRQAGFDYARYDMEHTPIATETLARLIGAAGDVGIGICVRPPSSAPTWISSLVRLGIRDFFVPQVHNAAQARSIVETVGETVDKANAGVPVQIGVMLESVEGFRNLEEIAAVKGLHVIGMGPADLAQELGVYGRPDESKLMDEYRHRLRAAAIAAGKIWEMGAWSQADAVEWIERGCKLLTYQTETTILRHAYGAATKLVTETK